MGSIHLYTAVSLDGYIADSDGSVAWLDEFQAADYGFPRFLDDIDTIIVGRATYEQLLSFGAWSYSAKQTYVLTRDPRRIAAAAPENTRFYAGDVRQLVDTINLETSKNVWLVGGAKTNAQFLRYRLVDHLHIAIMPVTRGRGLPLATPIDGATHFQLLASRHFDNGVVMMRYQRRETPDSESEAVQAR